MSWLMKRVMRVSKYDNTVRIDRREGLYTVEDSEDEEDSNANGDS